MTAIEALMSDRKAIHIDLNPMSVFMTQALISPVKITDLTRAFERIKIEYQKKKLQSESEINNALVRYHYPSGFLLPKGSDVKVIENLFSRKQLAQLGFLKYLILKEQGSIKQTLLLAFSSALTKTNRTYHNSNARSKNAGDSAAFRYYRYRIALNEVELDLFNTFTIKFKKIVAAKIEVAHKINMDTIQDAQVSKGTATNLSHVKKESVDYIYTDPPYGKKIPYLDLSVMWNAWLDLEVTQTDREQEAIEVVNNRKVKLNIIILLP